MAINFPTGLDSLTNPTSSDNLNSPDHAVQHANANDIVEALEVKVGINGSADTNSIDYKLSKLHHDVHTLHVDPNGATDYTTIASAVAYLGTLSTTEGYLISLDGDDHVVNDTITINLTMPIMIIGDGSAIANIIAGAGLINKDMFVIRSRTDFDAVYFYGDATWQAGTTATFLKYDTDNVYSEVQNFGMLTCKKGIEITAAASVFVFDYIIEDCSIGCDVNAAGNAVALDFEVGNMVNCGTSFNLAAASLADVYLINLRFLNELGQTGVAYGGAAFGYENFTIQSCEWNGVGTSVSGFDFTLARDANIEILGCVGIEDKKPHANIQLDSNATVTALSTNTWTKAAGTNSSSYSVKFGIANNRMTFLSDHSRGVMMTVSGALVQTTATQILQYAIVKNGNSATVYGKGGLTSDSANRPFPFSTNIYIDSIATNDYFELWIRNITDNDDATLQDLNWTAFSV